MLQKASKKYCSSDFHQFLGRFKLTAATKNVVAHLDRLMGPQRILNLIENNKMKKMTTSTIF